MTLVVFAMIWFDFSIFSSVLVSIEKINQSLNTAFDHISKHLQVIKILP